jgi:hypothetical protein
MEAFDTPQINQAAEDSPLNRFNRSFSTELIYFKDTFVFNKQGQRLGIMKSCFKIKTRW